MINPDDPAFPLAVTNNNGDTQWSAGMSLRTYAAIQAMKGMAAGAYWRDSFDGAKPQRLSVMAETAVKAADALVAELNKPKEAK